MVSATWKVKYRKGDVITDTIVTVTGTSYYELPPKYVRELSSLPGTIVMSEPISFTQVEEVITQELVLVH